MSTLRFIRIGLFAFSLSFITVACSNDEDETISTNSDSTNSDVTKKLIQIVEEDYEYGKDKDYDIYHFSYDNDGNLISVTKNKETTTIRYSEDSITCYKRETGEEEYDIVTFRLSNGKIISGTEDISGLDLCTHNYTYKSNHLSETIGDLGSQSFFWEGDKLIGGYKYIDKDDYAYSLEYSGKTCKGYNPAFVLLLASDIMYEADFFPIVVNPELAGFKTNQLPDSMIEHNEIIYFTYEQDEDGYLTKCKVVEEDGEYEGYTFTWE